jgi:hypothetical protein
VVYKAFILVDLPLVTTAFFTAQKSAQEVVVVCGSFEGTRQKKVRTRNKTGDRRL